MSQGSDMTARDYHTRSFPDYSFVPSSARAMNARHIDAIFMNALWSAYPPETTASELLSTIIQTQVEGNQAAVADFKELLDKVWFQPNRGAMRKSAPELLISHVGMGLSYRPTGHYNLDRWVPAILTRAGVVDGDQRDSKLRQILELASRRPMNLIEKAIVHTAQPAPPTSRPPYRGQMALPRVVDTLASLIQRLLDQADWQALPSQPEAERIVLDLLALLRTAYYILWIQIHLNAQDALDALRERRAVPELPRRLFFGFETERYAAKARRFRGTRSILENDLERGDYSLMALSQMHAVLDARDPQWFNGWDKHPMTTDELKKVHRWFSDYDAIMRRQGLANPWRIADPLPSDSASLLVLMEQSIEANNRGLRPRSNQRAAYTFTWGAVPGMSAAEGPRLFTNLGPGRGMGVQAMVNTALILLVGRSIMSRDRVALLLRSSSSSSTWASTLTTRPEMS